jgi:glyoxylase-like metal-dependent hydrolase (beta-lactamase superfamily II)
MEIYPLKTGSVKVKQAQRSRQRGGMLRVITGNEWTEWLPIYAWLIKHPEGNFVIDTGETARTAEPDYFPSWHPYYRYAVKMDVSPDQEIDQQLRKYDLEPSDVDTVVLTHFHTDHAGGLYHFENSRILVPGTEYNEAKGIMGQMRGYLPQHWMDWFAPEEIAFRNLTYGSFEQSMPLTKDGSLFVVPTPGHTNGHVSVIANTGFEHIMFAGDTSYTQDLLLKQQPDGVSPNTEVALQTQRNILKFAERNPLVYLPSHDPEAVQRLEERRAIGSISECF